MLTFREHLDLDFLAEDVSPNDKGVLHELLTGKALNNGEHMSPEAKSEHDKIKSRITDEEYQNHVKMAEGTAHALRKKFGDIKSAHWSSKPGDIAKITGVHETQQENPSDIILKHHDGGHTGVSLKITQKKHQKIPVGNPGIGQTDKALGTDAKRHYEKAKDAFEKEFPELKGMSDLKKKEKIKANPLMRLRAEHHSREAIGKIRDEWHDRLHKLTPHELAHHLRHSLHANATKIPTYKVTTGGNGNDHSVEIEHPGTEYDHILNHPEGITIHKAGNNSIEFKHNGKRFARHRIKPASTPIATPLKGSIEY